MCDRRDLLKTIGALGGTGLGASFAGCSGRGSDTQGTETTTGRPTTETATAGSTTTRATDTAAATVTVSAHETFGEILADASGRTLYMFTKDTEGESACYGDCAAAWPPLTVENEGALEVGSAVTAALGTAEREDGTLQVTANGMPLYLFANDEGPGDAKGQGVGGAWFVLRPDGSVVMDTTPTGTPTSTRTETSTATPTEMPSPTPTETPTGSDGGGGY